MMRNYLLMDGAVSVAEICEFTDGTGVVRWSGANATTAIHRNVETLDAVHVQGHANRRLIAADPLAEWTVRATHDAALDEMENVPWGSLGSGVVGRFPDEPRAPEYVPAQYRGVYIAAYLSVIPHDTEFGWRHALTINPRDDQAAAPEGE